MTNQAPQKPGPGGMVNDDKDPTQRMPSGSSDGDPEARAILDQQHTGNHQKPNDESADKRGGTRAGAENVEPKDAPQKDRETG